MSMMDCKIILNCAGYEYEQYLLIHHDQQNGKGGEGGVLV